MIPSHNDVANQADSSLHSSGDFVRDIVSRDQQRGKHGGRVVTRFPPEPNGYLHVGHAKSICLNFGIAAQFGGTCHLRFDDTNPTGESLEYVESIKRDVRWLGFDWHDNLFFASDYFQRLYEFAEELIGKGKAYVCSLNEEEIRAYRGTITEAGRPSPYRERSVEENLEMFRRMRAGEFPDGAHVLRARIDMASPNMKMRDPLMYRIRHVAHYRTGMQWPIYSLYDFTHCLSDALEGITHSVCTLEFENNRELYDWFIDNVDAPCHPQQIEFARLNLTYTVMSKRRLLELVRDGHVLGWDDPRMPTIAGIRRRGVPPTAIRAFADRIGVAKNNSTVDVALLEHCIRDELNPLAPRVLAVLEPLKVVIDNYPAGEVEQLDAPFFPPDVGKEGSRKLPFSRELWIERSDFMLEPPKGFHRLSPGNEVRLRHAYLVRCDRVRRDAEGNVVEVGCSYDPESLGKQPAGRRVKGTLHWVSAEGAMDAEVRLYDRLFNTEIPGNAGHDFKDDLNPNSLVVAHAKVEACVAQAGPGTHFQFERQGFFYSDPVEHASDRAVYNRVVPLKDTWAKLSARSASIQNGAEAVGRKNPAAAQPTVAKGALSQSARELVDAFGIGEEEARVLGDAAELRGLFSEAIAAHDSPRAVAAWIVNEVRALAKERTSELPFGGTEVGHLVAMVDGGLISGTTAKAVLVFMADGEGDPRNIVEKRGLGQIGDGDELRQSIESVLSGSTDLVERYRAGNKNLLGALLGQVMRQTQGKVDAKIVREVLQSVLDSN